MKTTLYPEAEHVCTPSFGGFVTIFGEIGSFTSSILDSRKEGAEALIKAMCRLQETQNAYRKAFNKRSHGAEGNVMKNTRSNFKKAVTTARTVIDALIATKDVEFRAAIMRAESFYAPCYEQTEDWSLAH